MTGAPGSSAGAARSCALDPFVALLREPARLSAQDLPGWDRALRLARASNLLGRLAVEVAERGELHLVPAEVAPHLVAAQRLVEHQQAGMARECRRIDEALRGLQVPVVLLKGAAYASTGRRASRGRLFGDVDIMVPRSALPATEAALMREGWAIGHLDPYDERYYRQWMHELPPMAHLQRGTVIDVHHNILPLTSRLVPDAALLLAESLPVPGTGLRVLAPADMLIHSAVHLFHEGELRNGLRDLLDLDALMREFAGADADFWVRLPARAARLGLARPVHLAMRYAVLVLASPVPEGAAAELERQAGLARWRQSTLDAMYLRAFRPEHPLTGSPSIGVARMALYLRGHALRMPLPRLALHLGRKVLMRSFKHSSRRGP